MSDCGDLPPIDPARRAEFDKALKDFLFPPRGQVVYSQELAKRIARNLLAFRQKKAREAVWRLVRALRATPQLDAMVATEIQLKLRKTK